MNIHGYKQKSKAITQLIREEESKKGSNSSKLSRLENAKGNVLNKIRELKLARGKKR